MTTKTSAPEKNELVADAIYDLSKSIRLLGNGNIDRGDLAIGAVEGLAMMVRDSNEKIAESISYVSDSNDKIAGSLDNIAEAINNLAQAILSQSKRTDSIG